MDLSQFPLGWFQSAPHPKVRRNAEYQAYGGPEEVSIRSSPEGEEKQSEPADGCQVGRFNPLLTRR